MATPGAGSQIHSARGNLCLKGFCPCRPVLGENGSTGRLPAKMSKREPVLRKLLGPRPWPEELLREWKKGGKFSEGWLGDVRYCKVHLDEENMDIRQTMSKSKDGAAIGAHTWPAALARAPPAPSPSSMGAISALLPKCFPPEQHAQDMAHARWPHGSEVPRYTRSTRRMA